MSESMAVFPGCFVTRIFETSTVLPIPSEGVANASAAVAHNDPVSIRVKGINVFFILAAFFIFVMIGFPKLRRINEICNLLIINRGCVVCPVKAD